MPNDDTPLFPALAHVATASGIAHRVVADEVDAFHVVHFSKYLAWFSAAMIAAFQSRGLGPGTFDEGRVEIRMARVQVAYMKSARLNDVVDIDISRIETKSKGLQAYVQARIGNDVLARGRLTVACVVAATGELAALPQEVLDAFKPGFDATQVAA